MRGIHRKKVEAQMHKVETSRALETGVALEMDFQNEIHKLRLIETRVRQYRDTILVVLYQHRILRTDVQPKVTSCS